MKKGFGLISLLIVVGIMVFIILRFYNLGSNNQVIKESGGVTEILDQTENIVQGINVGNKEIQDALDEI